MVAAVGNTEGTPHSWREKEVAVTGPTRKRRESASRGTLR